MKENTGYNQLLHKLDKFIRKYYTNQLIRGSLLFLGLNLFLFIIFNVLESQFYFSAGTRKILFYGGLGILLLSLILWIGVPLFKFLKLGPVISHDEAAGIIGDHFPEVKDKLLNILQLARQADTDQNDLILYGVEQKTDEIKLVSFPKAIDLTKNRKYLKYALPPFLLLVLLLFSAPSLITDSSYRILHNDREFEREAPFEFQLLNEDLSLPQFDDIEILMNTDGRTQPQEIFINVDGLQYKMKKNREGNYSYLLKNVGAETDFYFSANGFSSHSYTIDILKKPSLSRMSVRLNYPRYTGIEDKTVQNEGNLVFPAGTKLTWTFDTENMDALDLKFSDESVDTSLHSANDVTTFSRRIYKNTDYKLIYNSPDIRRADSTAYSLESIPDEFPKISIQTRKDSLDAKVDYIVGEASDDYGIRELTYNYAIVPADADPDEEMKFEREVLSGSAGKATTFQKVVDVHEFDLKPGSALIYYFEVYDNDGVNGSKSAKTALQKWTQRTVEEFEALEEENKEQIKSRLEKVLRDQKELIRSSEDLHDKLLQEKDFDWQRKKEMEKLLENQRNIQKQLQEAQNLHDQNQENRQQYKDGDQQNDQEIQDLMDQAKNPKLEELMDKIQELMNEKMDKDEALNELRNLSNQMKQSEMDIERLEKLYNKLQMESDIMDQVQKLEDLAAEQEKLAEENLKDETSTDSESESGEENTTDGEEQNGEGADQDEKGAEDQAAGEEKENSGEDRDGSDSSSDQKMEEQERLNEAFEKLSEKLEELFEKNQEMGKPANMDNPKTPSEEIKRDQNQSMQEMKSGSDQKAGQKQKDAGQKMKEMAESMQQNMQGGQQEQMQEDMQTLRQILENLIRLSFDQEDLILEIAPLAYATPQYVDKVRKQFDLKNNFSMVRDSLLALANRNPQIQSAVTEKVNLIDNHLDLSMDLLEDQEKSKAGNDQRRVMKNVNDLALMLTEALQNMQMEMSSAQSMCQNPGSGSGEGDEPMDKITKGQEKLTEEMKNMSQRQKQGEGGTMSEEFAKTAAEQAALRKMLQDKQQKLMEQGKGSKELQQLIDMMDETETDLVNKKLTNEMMQRQQEILTRLLEAEKAEREQEEEEKRQSESAKNIQRTLPPELEDYLKQRREEITPYQKLSPSLKPYYKRLVEEYYEELKNR